MRASTQDIQFIAKHEGFVSKAYRCPAGVITIGYGFTNGSRVFSAWARSKWGRALRMGDTITRAEADTILRRLVDEEYGLAVNQRIAPKQQHHYGAASSVAYNCGIGSLSWNWAKALAGQRIAESATRLRTTAVTANGRRLPGLVRRRSEESILLEHGRYTGLAGPSAAASNRASIKQWQQWLIDLGYNLGASKVDGVQGARTTEAVKKFQRDNGLKVDGIVGPATLSTIIRLKDAKLSGTATGTAGAGGLAGTIAESVSQGGLPTTGVAIAAVALVVAVAAGLYVWRNRGRATGKRVAVA